MNIALIGYRGSGKTTVGKLLAQRLHFAFLDTDAAITQAAGMTIKDIFATQGETAFRNLESQTIASLATRDRHILALGGGAVLRSENIAALKPRSTIVYLAADPQTLYQRITADTATAATRPNLTSAGGLPEVQALLAQRLPLYQAAADLTINVTHLTPQQAADQIAQSLNL